MIAQLITKIKIYWKLLLAYFLVTEVPLMLEPILQNSVVVFIIEISFLIASLYLWAKLFVDWITASETSSNSTASLNAVVWKTIKWAFLAIGLALIPIVVVGVLLALAGLESVFGWTIFSILSWWIFGYANIRLSPSVVSLIRNNEDRKLWSSWAQTKHAHTQALKLSMLLAVITVPLIALSIYVNGLFQNFGSPYWEPSYSLDMFIANAFMMVASASVYLECIYRFNEDLSRAEQDSGEM